MINLEQLILQPRSYINDLRKESTVDLLFKTQIEKQEGFLYLLVEHQSTADELMPFRILKYTCNIIDQHLKNAKNKTIPLIYPIVIYHANRSYSYSTDIRDLVSAPKKLVDEYFLKPFQLIDIGRIDDQELKQHAWIGIMEFVLKHIYARDIIPPLKTIADLMKKVALEGGEDYISIVLEYALERGELKNKQDFFDLVNKQISSEVGEKIMTGAEQLFAEGRLEDRLEGKLEVAQSLLAGGMETDYVAKITGLPLETIQSYK